MKAGQFRKSVLRRTFILAAVACTGLLGVKLYQFANTREIPLQDIWALSMPGTQDVHNLEPQHFGAAIRQLPEPEKVKLLFSSFSQQIQEAIQSDADTKPIGTAFVVSGTGLEALEKAKDVLEQGTNSSSKLSGENEVTLFFYSYQSGRYVQLTKISQYDHVITVRYQSVPHYSKNLTQHYALIPLGRLSAGTYHVEIVQDSLRIRDRFKGYKPLDEKLVAQTICQPTEFSIVPAAK